jgi:hypothetical protein
LYAFRSPNFGVFIQVLFTFLNISKIALKKEGKIHESFYKKVSKLKLKNLEKDHKS